MNNKFTCIIIYVCLYYGVLSIIHVPPVVYCLLIEIEQTLEVNVHTINNYCNKH